MERSTKHEAKLILTWLISVAMIGLGQSRNIRVCTLAWPVACGDHRVGWCEYLIF
jgi:hypothetical protein